MATQAKGRRWPLEAGKGKGTDPPLELPEGTGPANTLMLAQCDPVGLLAARTVGDTLCCFNH